MSASNEMKRYRLSYRHGVIEEDGSPRSCDDSKPMYLCAEADAAMLAKDEVIARLLKENATMREIHNRRKNMYYSMRTKVREARAIISQLRGEVAEAKKDGERLDWLIVGDGAKKAARVMGSVERGWSVCDCSDGLVFLSRALPDFRTAIDAAIAKP